VAGRRADLLVGAGGAATAALLTVIWGGTFVGSTAGTEAAAYVLGVGLGAALGLARPLPRAAWLGATGLLLAAAAAGVLAGGDAFVVLPLVAAHAFCAARGENRVWSIVALVTLVFASALGGFVAGDSMAPYFLFPPAAWGAGRALRERELVAEQLAERARELEEEREAYAALSVRYERARIASELHDIVAHAISVMVVQASAGQRLVSDDPRSTADAFDAIADAARQAEEDMGLLVALLGDDEAIGEAPDLSLVEEIVARAAGSGLDVTLRLEGDRERLPAEVARTACRVVQEGLTNALRYAAGAAVAVVVHGEREELLVSVANAPAARAVALAGTGTGNGLRGLRERVGAVGGTLDAGPTPEGGWRVAARMPRRVAAHPRG
jgi:signal transduction histidine kinase